MFGVRFASGHAQWRAVVLSRRRSAQVVSLVTALAATLPVRSARADVSDITLLGDQANLMAGAVTASTQAGPSIWYNPARLSFAGDHSVEFAVSGAGFALRRYKVPGFVRGPNGDSPGKSAEVLALPRATTLVARARERLNWGIGIFIPTRQDVVLQVSQSDAGEPMGFNAYALRTRRNSVHVAGAISYKLNERISLGASLNFVTYSFFRMSLLSSAAYDAETGAANAVVNTSSQDTNRGYGFRPTLGLSIRVLPAFFFGISASAPTMLFYARLQAVESAVSAMNGDGIQFKPSARDKRGGAWEVVEPAVARIGFAYRGERTLWEIDGEITGGAKSSDFEVDEPITGNLRAGAIVGLLQNVRVGFGFFTDLDHKQGNLNQIADTRMRGLGGTLGLNVISRLPGRQADGDRKGTYSITLATRYARFSGDILGISIAESGQPAAITTVATHGVIHEFTVQVGVNGAW
jgi:long-subunit fatty acid transport protein